MSGFKKTGIWPINPDVFTEEDFAPAAVTEQPDPATMGPTLDPATIQLPATRELPAADLETGQQAAPDPATRELPAADLATGQQPAPDPATIQQAAPDPATRELPAADLATGQQPAPDPASRKLPAADLATGQQPSPDPATRELPAADLATGQQPAPDPAYLEQSSRQYIACNFMLYCLFGQLFNFTYI